MNHFILNLADAEATQAAGHLHARAWPLARGQRHGDRLAPGDRVLIHVGRPACAFIGRAVLASAFEVAPAPQETARGIVSLTDVERWPRAVPLDAAVARIDPMASNPVVQANAAGFRSGIVRITAGEYDAVVSLALEARRP